MLMLRNMHKYLQLNQNLPLENINKLAEKYLFDPLALSWARQINIVIYLASEISKKEKYFNFVKSNIVIANAFANVNLIKCWAGEENKVKFLFELGPGMGNLFLLEVIFILGSNKWGRLS